MDRRATRALDCYGAGASIRIRSMLALIVRLLLMIVRTRNTERVDLVVSRSGGDVSITRSPIDGAVHDGWPVQYRAPARKAPEDVSGDRVQRVHLPRVGARVQDAICNAHRGQVHGAWSGVRGLPEDRPSVDIESAPRTPGNLPSRGHQRVRHHVPVRDGDTDTRSVGRGTPLDPSERTAWTDRRAPDDVAVIGIQRPIDAALLTKADDAAHQVGSRSSQVEIRAGGYGTVRLRSRREHTRDRPGVVPLQPLRPLDPPGLQIQCQGGVEEIISRRAVRGGIRVLESFPPRGRGVVVAGPDEERTALWIDRRWLPHRSAAVSALLTAVVRHIVGLPEHRTGPGVARAHAAAKGAARIGWIRCQGFFDRRDPHVDDPIEDAPRSRDDCCRMTVHLRDPPASS